MTPKGRPKKKVEVLEQTLEERLSEKPIVEEKVIKAEEVGDSLTVKKIEEPVVVEEKKPEKKPETKLDTKPFIEVEEYRPIGQLDAKFTDPGLDKMYRLRWLKKAVTGSDRKGIWHVIKKEHPHFKPSVLHVEVDHSPSKSFYSMGDLVLCVTRRETAESRNRAVHERTARGLEQVGETFAEEARKALPADVQTERPVTFDRLKQRRGGRDIAKQGAHFR